MHNLLAKDADTMTGECSECGPVDLYWKPPTKQGSSRYLGCKTALMLKERKREASRVRTYRLAHRAAVKERLAKMVCERCSFHAEDVTQLDVDHILRRADGGTDATENLCVLCANCHRLKSLRERLQGFDYEQFMMEKQWWYGKP